MPDSRRPRGGNRLTAMIERKPLTARRAASTSVERAVRVSRVNGGLAGTPFLIALVPAYISVLWEQARMLMRIAALSGRDPATRWMSAELLTLRRVYPSAETARAELDAVERDDEHRKLPPRGHRIAFARGMLVLSGFLDAKDAADEGRGRLMRMLYAIGGVVVFVLTWVVPVTFILLMAWTAERETKRLGDAAIERYFDGPALRVAAGSHAPAVRVVEGACRSQNESPRCRGPSSRPPSTKAASCRHRPSCLRASVGSWPRFTSPGPSAAR